MERESVDQYRRFSDYSSHLNRINYRVKLTANKNSDKVSYLTPEKREILKDIEKGTLKRLEDN